MRELCDSGVQVGQTLDGPTVGKRDRGQGPPRRRALGGEVAQRQRERAPSGVVRAHPAEVEMHALDEHVAARDDHTRRNPSAINRPTFVSSMPPIANTGTPGPTSVAMAATPLGPMTFFSDLIGVAKAGPLPR